MTSTVPNTFDPKVFREVMGNYPTGVAIVTGRTDDGELLALVVGTFASVSLDPPLVSFMPMKSSRTFQKLRNCKSLCISILGGEQQSEMLAVAQRWENKLDGIDWYPSPSGDPILRNAIAWVDTTIAEVVEAGDHWIVLCSVTDLQITNTVPPLLFFQGGYGNFAGLDSGSRMSNEILPAIHAAHSQSEQLRNLAETGGCGVAVDVAVSDDELATVFSALSADATREGGLASRVPLVPPIGDSYLFDKSAELQEKWIGKLRKPSDEIRELHQRRLKYMRDHGYLLNFLPEKDSNAYDQMNRATREYKKAVLTPLEERSIRETIGSTPVDYEPRDIVAGETYHVGSAVFPVRDPLGKYTMTLRLSQLPCGVSGATIQDWVKRARTVIDAIESSEETAE